jgi:hypothetical protein
MTSEMALFTSGALARDAQRTSRVLSRIEADGLLRQSAVDVETDVTIAKMDGETLATGTGLGEIGRVAQIQMALEQLTPQASGRLNPLAEDHALAMRDEFHQLRRRLRRL